MTEKYLIIHCDLRVGITFVEWLDLTQVVLLWQFHHSEENRRLSWESLEVKLPTDLGNIHVQVIQTHTKHSQPYNPTITEHDAEKGNVSFMVLEEFCCWLESSVFEQEITKLCRTLKVATSGLDQHASQFVCEGLTSWWINFRYQSQRNVKACRTFTQNWASHVLTLTWK